MAILNNPVALGKVLVAAAGTPVSLVSNFSSTDPDYSGLTANKIDVDALTTNTGKIFVGYSGMNTTTGVKVLKELQAGQSWSITDPAANNCFDVFKLLIDAEVNGEGGYASCHRK